MTSSSWSTDQFVWANWGKKPYPGVIVDKSDEQETSKNEGKQKVLWLGDRNYSYSMVNIHKLLL